MVRNDAYQDSLSVEGTFLPLVLLEDRMLLVN